MATNSQHAHLVAPFHGIAKIAHALNQMLPHSNNRFARRAMWLVKASLVLSAALLAVDIALFGHLVMPSSGVIVAVGVGFVLQPAALCFAGMFGMLAFTQPDEPVDQGAVAAVVWLLAAVVVTGFASLGLAAVL